MAPPVIVKHSHKSASFRIRSRHFREHANVFKVEKPKFPRACKYLLRCAQLGLWVSVAYQAALTNHRDFQLLPLMDEPVFQSGAIDVLAESGQPAPGTRRPNRAPWGSQFLPTFPQFLLFYFFSVPSYFFLIPTFFSVPFYLFFQFFSIPSFSQFLPTFSQFLSFLLFLPFTARSHPFI